MQSLTVPGAVSLNEVQIVLLSSVPAHSPTGMYSYIIRVISANDGPGYAGACGPP